MSARRVHVMVLCEGLADYWFAYRCLTACGWRHDQIRSRISPRGKGSGFSFVLDRYTEEVQGIRGGSSERALLVLVDADTQSMREREAELDRRLQEARQERRQARERIALWVPKRQIETWVHFLTHGEADEETDYKRQHRIKGKRPVDRTFRE
jgi:hypothetical protein